MSKKIIQKSYSRQDGTVFYRKSIRINGEKTEKVFSRKSDSERWYLEKKREKELVEGGLGRVSSVITIKNYAKEWLDERKANGKPVSSWSMDETRLRLYIIPQFGDRELNKISTREWEAFLGSLVADELIGPATRNRIRSLANKMYNDALRKGEAAHNPVRVIPKLKESMEAWDYWTSGDEILNYLAEAKKEAPSFYLFACLSLNLGIRIGEVLALDHSDVNISQRRVHIAKTFEEVTGIVFNRVKGNKERWLGLNDSITEVLIEYRNQTSFRRSNEPLICDDNGARYFARSIRKTHEKVCKRAQVKDIRIHDLRHTYASHYVMNGGTLAELQALMGHSSPMMTMKYAHLAPGYLEKRAGVVSFSLPKSNVISLRKID